jgi:hypothetical protein
MTFEQMQEIARQVARALNSHPTFSEAAYVEDASAPGEPLLISFVGPDGDELGLDLDVL